MTRLDTIQVKRFALMQLQGRWILPLVIQLITTVIASLFYVPIVAPVVSGGTVDDVVMAAEKPLPVASMIVFCLVVRVFFVAELEVYAQMTRGPKAVGFGTFIDGFADWRRAVVVTVHKWVLLYLWAMLLFVPAAIKFYSYYFAEYIAAEFPAVKATRAVGLSRRIMSGHKMELLWLDVTLLPWVLLGACLGSVGLVWAMPYVRMTHINAFHALLKAAIEDGRVSLSELGATAEDTESATSTDDKSATPASVIAMTEGEVDRFAPTPTGCLRQTDSESSGAGSEVTPTDEGAIND